MKHHFYVSLSIGDVSRIVYSESIYTPLFPISLTIEKLSCLLSTARRKNPTEGKKRMKAGKGGKKKTKEDGASEGKGREQQNCQDRKGVAEVERSQGFLLNGKGQAG